MSLLVDARDDWQVDAMRLLHLSQLKTYWRVEDVAQSLGRDLAVVRVWLAFFSQSMPCLQLYADHIVFAQSFSVVDAHAMMRALSLDNQGLRVFWTLSSTQDYCMQHLDQPSLEFCLSEHQFQGRGRRSRPWYASFASGILFSYKTEVTADFPVPAYGLMLALCIVESLSQRFPRLAITLKWPNDVLIHGEKLMGILIEVVRYRGRLIMIAGVGCNYFPIPKDASVEAVAAADTEMKALGKTALTVLLMQCCREARERMLQGDFSAYVQRYNANHFLHGQWVEFDHQQHRAYGQVKGVSACGALHVETAAEDKKLFSVDQISRVRVKSVR